jgi:hypothetical protein
VTTTTRRNVRFGAERIYARLDNYQIMGYMKVRAGRKRALIIDEQATSWLFRRRLPKPQAEELIKKATMKGPSQ